MKNALLIYLSILISCRNPTSKNEINTNRNIPDSLNHKEQLYTLDPDTALAVFLWNDTNPDFDNSIEEYTRLATERPKVLTLINSLFHNYPNYDIAIHGLEKRSIKFDQHVKKTILKEAKEYGTLFDSRELWYLEQVHKPFFDSIIKLYPLRHPENIPVKKDK